MMFTCNTGAEAVPFPHFWKHTVGSDHATMALRADWQQQLLRCHNELGFKYVRFHGILSDDMGTLMNEMDQLVYSFFNTDQICDYLLSIGMRPFIELSFMPSCLSSGDAIVFHYKGNITPPRDYNQWDTFIIKLVQHWVDRYGIEEVSQWFFEVWNEPNLMAFWTGTQADYFKLYQHTAEAIKSVSPLLQVGGPATADNAWVADFRTFCESNNVPYDFISTHHYPTDDFGQPGDDTIAQLAASKRSALRDEVILTRQRAGDKPVYYTEWCTSSNPFDDLHDIPYAAAFVTKTVMEAQGMVQGYSYWTFSDLFEENYFSSLPFHGGFGLLTIYGIAKPVYRAFQLMAAIGEEILPVAGTHETVDVWVTKKQGEFKILITNWALPKHPIQPETVQINLAGISNAAAAYIERIDDEHANARQAWVSMGQPLTLSKAQVGELNKISELTQEPVSVQQNKDGITIEVTMGLQSTACITIKIL